MKMSVKLCLVFFVVLLAINENHCHYKTTIFGYELKDIIAMKNNYMQSFDGMDSNQMQSKAGKDMQCH